MLDLEADVIVLCNNLSPGRNFRLTAHNDDNLVGCFDGHAGRTWGPVLVCSGSIFTALNSYHHCICFELSL